MKSTGISIPSSTVSYLRPVTCNRANSYLSYTSHIHENLERPWLISFRSVFYIDDPKEVFKFKHPNRKNQINNSRKKLIQFSTQIDCELTGFAGYFTANLYKNINISTHPEIYTSNMQSYHCFYFPIPKPIMIKKNDKIELKFERKLNDEKVWYEYQVSSEEKSEIVNLNGKYHAIRLDVVK